MFLISHCNLSSYHLQDPFSQNRVEIHLSLRTQIPLKQLLTVPVAVAAAPAPTSILGSPLAGEGSWLPDHSASTPTFVSSLILEHPGLCTSFSFSSFTPPLFVFVR